MKALTDACLKIAVDLEQMEVEIAALEADLASFEEHAVRWPGEQVALRLLALANAITEEALRLMAQHGGRGCVGVWRGDKGIGFIKWREDRELLADKEYYKARGSTVCFVEEMLGLIKYLVTELADGNWVPAVRFLNSNTIYCQKGGRSQQMG